MIVKRRMKNLFRRSSINWIYIPAILLNFYFIWYSSEIKYHIDTIDLIDCIQWASAMGQVCYITPILVSLPVVMRFYDERAEGVYRNHIMQTGKFRYAIRKILFAAKSGIAVEIASLLLFTTTGFIYAQTHSLPMSWTGAGMIGDELNPTIYYELAQKGFGWVAYLACCLALAVNGIVWPCIGTAISVLVRNKKIALASPFLIRRFWSYLISSNATALSPDNLELSFWTMSQPAGGIPYIICITCVIVMLCTGILYAGMAAILRRKG